MKVTATITIERNEEEIEVALTGDFEPGYAPVYYLRNGDPGYPGEPDSVEITSAKHDGKEIELTAEEIEQGEAALLEDAASRKESVEEDAAEARAERMREEREDF